MASIKELKKDIHYVTNELVIECMIADAVFEGKHENKLSELATKLLTKRTEFVDRINAYRYLKNDENAGEYFKKIRIELRDLVQEILDEVNKLNK
ncbi:MAG: hypothetical protein PF489_13385 [Salinivirgaceae bacterium]|jgi:hypothetical protein|nr:hypothetical protein [Salinivirgaceae bacterium]